MSDGNWPQGWGRYVSLLKDRGDSLPREPAVWAARFRAARAFSGVTFEGMSEKASSGYFVGLKLTLAESALETYEKARGIPIGSIGFANPDVSYELWEERAAELENALRRLENPRLQRAFQGFLLSDADTCQEFDLRVLLRAFRHLTAHGFFNPSSAGLYTSPKYRELLLEIAHNALQVCEEDFVSEVVGDGVEGSDILGDTVYYDEAREEVVVLLDLEDQELIIGEGESRGAVSD